MAGVIQVGAEAVRAWLCGGVETDREGNYAESSGGVGEHAGVQAILVVRNSGIVVGG